MFLSATLKKPWKSHRGKIYPIGTTFRFVKRFPGLESAMYDFNIPGKLYGFVVLPDKLFKQLTPEEVQVKERRRRDFEDHMKRYKDQVTRRKK